MARGTLSLVTPGGAQAAILAAAGWPVFPLVPGDRVPFRSSRGHLEASSDPEQVRDIFARRAAQIDGDVGVGVRCSGAAGFCLDLDRKNGKDGIAELKRLGLREVGTTARPRALWRTTPSGGAHVIFATPQNFEVATGRDVLGPGIDTRGPGGFRVHYDPLSAYENFSYGRSVDLSNLPDAPEWILDLPELRSRGARQAVDVELPAGPICPAVRDAARVDRWDFTDHHGTAQRIMHLVLLAEEGHTGVMDVLVALRPLYIQGRDWKTAQDGKERHPGDDYDRMVDGALSKGSGSPSAADPCERSAIFSRRGF